LGGLLKCHSFVLFCSKAYFGHGLDVVVRTTTYIATIAWEGA
jgi:hypothetical protein